MELQDAAMSDQEQTHEAPEAGKRRRCGRLIALAAAAAEEAPASRTQGGRQPKECAHDAAVQLLPVAGGQGTRATGSSIQGVGAAVASNAVQQVGAGEQVEALRAELQACHTANVMLEATLEEVRKELVKTTLSLASSSGVAMRALALVKQQRATIRESLVQRQVLQAMLDRVLGGPGRKWGTV
mmetsp:Transcript_22390/g.56995  ORF Transcript_22390/g.56995 Transcript_22390/m.56995 type:complete len:184 (-) Transcript_22390:126-677(-)